ncbi:MAG: carbohydrate ABC transporter permease [Limnochordia bacterium]|nr:carbohydrate ABC transporter permease [Limnochordia bacterium]
MQDTLLLRMRQSGWFDLLLFFLSVAIVLVALGLFGMVQYNVQMKNMAEGITDFEIRENLGMLASRRTSFTIIGLWALVSVVFGFVVLAIASFYQDKVSLQTKKKLGRFRIVLQYVAAIAITVIMLFPIYWMVISSLKTSTELLYPVPTLWPREFQWQNFPNVLNRAPFVRYLFNTLVSTFFMMIGELVIGILAAYGFAKGKFKGQNMLFMLVLGALMVPIQVTFVPIYVMISRLGWINSFPGLIVPNLVSAYFIFMLRQAFKAVDESYLDAGRVDGLGRIGLIWNVLIPMTKPTLITISIITFINGWNNYFWPKMVATRDEYRTIAVGVTRLRQTFAGMETANYNEIMAGAVMAIVPIILLFVVLQKYIMTGMSKAAMK